MRKQFVIALLLVSLATAGEAFLRPADPSKDLYQWTGWPPPGNMWFGGRCYKVQIDLETAGELQELALKKAKSELDLKEMQQGSRLMMIGMIIAAVGAAIHFVVAYPVLQRISEYILVFGGCLTGAGLILKKVSQYQGWIAFGLAIFAIGAILYKYRNLHLLKKRTK